jgi:hypothetical protein
MYPCFDVEGLSPRILLHDWQWLVSREFRLLAVNAFGDLFLEDAQGAVHRLDVAGGTISVVASSSIEFRGAAGDAIQKAEWFLEDHAERAEQRGYKPVKGQCVGAKTPWIFKESADVKDNIYVADLYEYVSFMGDIHRQARDAREGGQIRLRVRRHPQEKGGRREN